MVGWQRQLMDYLRPEIGNCTHSCTDRSGNLLHGEHTQICAHDSFVVPLKSLDIRYSTVREWLTMLHYVQEQRKSLRQIFHAVLVDIPIHRAHRAHRATRSEISRRYSDILC
jgi:hypothetical protein